MSFSGYEKKRLFRNNGRHGFVDVAAEAGVDNIRDGRGLVVADFDNDGAQDLYAINSNGPAILYHNLAGRQKSWMTIRLEGTRSNRDALGTRVTFHIPEGIKYRETSAGNGFEGAGTTEVHAGLGETTVVERLVVEWPSGTRQEFRKVEARTRYALKEGGELVPLPQGAGKAAP